MMAKAHSFLGGNRQAIHDLAEFLGSVAVLQLSLAAGKLPSHNRAQ
jgi:hypothetical protein